MAKPALVVSGNGARGSFQAGVLSKMIPDAFAAAYGTSSGALNSTLLSFVGPGGLLANWLSIRSINDVFQLNTNWEPALYNNSPLLAKATAVIANSPAIPVTVTVTDLLKFVSVFTTSGYSKDTFAQAVADSATIPVLVCDPDHLNLVDGGVLDDTPIDRAIADGHTDLVVMLADPYAETYDANYPDENIFPELVSALLNEGVRILDRVKHIQDWNAIQRHKHNVNITIYAPLTEDAVGGVLDFSSANIAKGIAAGQAASPQTCK